MTVTSFPRRTLPLNALRAFEVVAVHGSFVAGAAALSTTQSAVSRHIANLEALLALRLFERRPKGVALTKAGAMLLEAVGSGFDRIEQALCRLTSDEQLRIHVPPAFLHNLAMPFIAQYRALRPDVAVHILSTIGTGSGLLAMDVSIVFDRIERGREARNLLWEIEVAPACAPGNVERFRAAGLEALLESDRLLHILVADEPANCLWRTYAEAQGLHLNRQAGLMLETMTLATEYAVAGLGVTLVDTRMYADRLREGTLVQVFRETAPTGYGYFLQVDEKASERAAVRQLRDILIDGFTKGPVASVPSPGSVRRRCSGEATRETDTNTKGDGTETGGNQP